MPCVSNPVLKRSRGLSWRDPSQNWATLEFPSPTASPALCNQEFAATRAATVRFVWVLMDLHVNLKAVCTLLGWWWPHDGSYVDIIHSGFCLLIVFVFVLWLIDWNKPWSKTQTRIRHNWMKLTKVHESSKVSVVLFDGISDIYDLYESFWWMRDDRYYI